MGGLEEPGSPGRLSRTEPRHLAPRHQVFPRPAHRPSFRIRVRETSTPPRGPSQVGRSEMHPPCKRTQQTGRESCRTTPSPHPGVPTQTVTPVATPQRAESCLSRTRGTEPCASPPPRGGRSSNIHPGDSAGDARCYPRSPRGDGAGLLTRGDGRLLRTPIPPSGSRTRLPTTPPGPAAGPGRVRRRKGGHRSTSS